jgi:nitroreductase
MSRLPRNILARPREPTIDRKHPPNDAGKSTPLMGEPRLDPLLERLLTRHSVGAKHLAAPGPTDEQLWLAALAALRAPDHDKLTPFRFVVIPEDTRPVLADLYAESARREGRSAEEIAVERDRAMRAPTLVALVVRIDHHHPRAPAREQWMTAGGALSNFLTALHAMGYGAKMLSGRKVEDPAIAASFCEAGETLAGWIAVGTPTRAVHPRHNDNPDAVLRIWKPR